MNGGFSNERQFHRAFEAWMKSQNILFITSRMDRATTQQCGEPDYLCFENGRVLPLELKMPKTGKLSKDQVFRHAEYHKAGCRVFVVRELSAAIELVEAWRTQPSIYDEVKTGVRTLFGQQWRQKPGTTNELERIHKYANKSESESKSGAESELRSKLEAWFALSPSAPSHQFARAEREVRDAFRERWPQISDGEPNREPS